MTKNNPTAVKVKNIETGEVFKSIREAADSLNMNKYTLANILSGRRKNKTPLRKIKG